MPWKCSEQCALDEWLKVIEVNDPIDHSSLVMAKISGQCQCGAVRFAVTGKPVTAFVCHCTECQRQSGSAFGMAAWLEQAELHLERGQLKEWIRQTSSGKQMACQFCADCGSRLFHQVLGSSFLSVKPGSLDEPSQFSPVAHIWVASKQDWVEIPPHCVQFEGNPESMGALMQAWQAVH